MDDATKHRLGIYQKFYVARADREDRAGLKHDGCRLFVLDATHDLLAIPALRAYAEEAHRAGYHNLASDLNRWADELADHIDQPEITPAPKG